MRDCFNRSIKLLCYLFISIFMIGLGGEIVKAAPDSINVSKKSTWYDENGWRSYVKTTKIGEKDIYVFCLDSQRNIDYGPLTLDKTGLYSDKKTKVSAVIEKAYEFGLGNGQDVHRIKIKINNDEKTYNVSESDLYAITQIAVWNAVHGTGSDGAISKYIDWVSKHSLNDVYTALLSASNKKSYYAQIVPHGPHAMEVDDSGTDVYLVSKSDYELMLGNIPNDTRFTVEVNGGEMQIDGGAWQTGSATIDKSNKIKVRAKAPDTDGKVTVTLKITSVQDVIVGYDAYFYEPYGAGKQNIGFVLPKTKEMSNSISVSGFYNLENTDMNVELQKVDSETKEKIAGAKLELYDSSNNLLGTYTSTSGENPKVTLPVGEYYLKEVEAPIGYNLSNETFGFEVVEQDDELKLKQNGEFVDFATVTVENSPYKIKFRKVDAATGEPIEGVKIKIINYVDLLALKKDTYLYVCAVTDRDGYLTKPCNKEDLIVHFDNLDFGISKEPEDYYNSDGIYNLQDFDDANGYAIIEGNVPSGYSNSIFTESNLRFQFYLSPTEFSTIYPNYISFDGTLGEDAVVTINIKNYKYIDISKTDLNSGSEIAGANMSLFDKNQLDLSNENDSASDTGSYLLVDSWISEEETHRIEGIIPGHRYILRETISPEGYIRITTDIEFSMDENGKVTVYTENASVNSSAYKLEVGNDYTKVKISKTDIVSKEEVEGATLKLCTASEYDSKGLNCSPSKSEWTWVSGKSAKEINKLEPGDYYLIETIVPAGYVQQTNSVKFTVLETGEIQTVAFENTPTKVVIYKRDRKTDKDIKGAVLQIFTEDGKEVKDSNDNLLKWTSDGNAWVIEKVLSAGNYVIKELTPAEGYEGEMIVDEKVVNEYSFTISADAYEHEIVVYNAVLQVPNTGVSLVNMIAIGGLMVFIGYETIKIYRRKSVN